MNNSEEKRLLIAFETMINTADEALAEKMIAYQENADIMKTEII